MLATRDPTHRDELRGGFFLCARSARYRMGMPIATLTRKAQLTLPKEIREHLGVQPGDRVEFRKDPAGRVWVEAATLELSVLRGLFGPVETARSQADLDEAVRRGAKGESE